MEAMGSPNAGHGKKVLVIDDDPVARADLQARLKAKDYTVAFAADATSAVTAANRERPDLILLDIGLPGGGGFVVMQRLRTILHLAAVPVVVISGRHDEETMARARALGAAAYLQKPVATEVLFAAIRAAFGDEPVAP